MFRPLEVFIGLRYTRAKRRNHFISFISLVSIFGIALGVTALIPADGIKVESELLRIDLPVMILVTLVSLPIFATGRTVSRREGGLMVAAYLCYLTSLIVMRG